MKDLDSPTPANRYRTLLLFGAPGCGKGTQGRIIGSIPRFHFFSCGDAFRSLDTRSPIGQKFVHYSSRGELVPDELTVELWRTQIDKQIASDVFKPDIDLLILDGIPRNVEQAKIMEDALEIHGVLHLSCPDRDELARRIRKRALKENRMDDANEQTIQHRFDTYMEESKPILEHYGPELVHMIDASQPPVKVLTDALQTIMKIPVWKSMSQVVA